MGDRSDHVSIRNYEVEDLPACRALWVELTDWHRQIYGSPHIGGSDPGRQFDEHLHRVGRERIWLATIGDDVVGMVGMIPSEWTPGGRTENRGNGSTRLVNATW